MICVSPQPSPVVTPPVLRGNRATYRLNSKIGEGAYGQTFLATVQGVFTSDHLWFRKGYPVAIKIAPLLDDTSYSSAQRRKYLTDVNSCFRNEYALHSKLVKTKSSAHLLDTGAYSLVVGGQNDLSFFVVYEFIQGAPLRRWVQQRGIRLSSSEFFHLARDITQAVYEIHAVGVVHGDLWPQNIMMTPADKPIVIDFGESHRRVEIERIINEQKPHPYLAPEREVSIASDIFSLGGILFFIATGEDPPKVTGDRDSVKSTIQNALNYFNPSLIKSSYGVPDIIARCLRPSSSFRIQSARDVLIDLDLFDDSQHDKGTSITQLVDNIQLVLTTVDLDDPLNNWIISKQLSQLKQTIQDLSNEIYEVRGSHDELVLRYSEFLAMIGPTDEYLAISMPWFWYPDNIGIRGRGLELNRRLVHKGTTLRRVFMISEEELADEYTLQVLQAHAEMVNELAANTESEPFNTQCPQLDAGGIYAGVIILPSEERDKMFSDYPHGGLSANGNTARFLVPVFDRDKRQLTDLQIKPATTDYITIRKRYETEYLARAIEIRRFLAEDLGCGVETRK